MRKIVFPIGFAFLMIGGIFGWIRTAQGQTPDGQFILNQEVQGENTRQIEAPSQAALTNAPDIGFIDSPSATCYQPVSGRDECFINWYYLNVDAAPSYMIAMTVTINEIGPVARTQGFFQTSMYVPYNMFGNGFKVACGSLGAGGQPNLGKAYAYTIRARDSANLTSANYGTAYCPAYVP